MTRAGTHHDVRKQYELTPRQRQVVELMARGYTNYQIGQALGISLDGAKWHVSEVIGKLDVTSREEAVARWREYNRPVARLSRALNAFASIEFLRWASLGVAGIAIAGVIVVVVAVAGGSSGAAPPPLADPSQTPAPTSTSPAVVATASPIPNTPAPSVVVATAPPIPATPAPSPAPDAEEIALQVFLLRNGDVAAVRRVVPATVAVARAAIESLIAGPTDAEAASGLSSAVVADIELLGLSIEDGVATIDFSDAFLPGDAPETIDARLAQVVFTLTQYSTVDAVIVLVDGTPIQDTSPLSRDDFEDLSPAILVNSPAQGDTISAPLTVTGTANTFEATFQLELINAEGATLASETITASSGSGERGEFEATIAFEAIAPGPVLLRVYENSAQDGSPINVVEIPVILAE